jgi:Polysaccharide lyase
VGRAVAVCAAIGAAGAVLAVLGAAGAGAQSAIAADFKGGFESGTYRPWKTPQCANYGHANTSTRTFGQFVIDGSTAGAGRYSGQFTLPADATHLTRCQVITPRPVNTGGDDYYSLMFYVPTRWTSGTGAFWGVSIAAFNFENLWGGPVQLQLHAHHVTLAVQTGVCADSQCQYASNADSPGHPNLPPLYAVPPGMQQGVWHELVVHCHWATDATGVIEVWHRLKGEATWTKTVSFTGYPTLQTHRDGSVPQRTVDILSAYRGRSTEPVTVWLDAFSRSQTLAAAQANLP